MINSQPEPLEGFRVGPLEVKIFEDKSALSRAAAYRVAEELKVVLQREPTANLVLATGASQYDFLDSLLQQRGIEWQRVRAFHLDEYLDLPRDHPAGFRRFLQERFFDHVEVGEVHLLNGNAPDPDGERRRYAALLAAHPIDIACIGIGENGHLAFNDPPADFDTDEPVLVVELDEACRLQQVGEGHFAGLEEVPQKALSLSIPAILGASFISCVVPGDRKAEAVNNALTEPISPQCPASALRNHANTTLYLDTGSASRLPPKFGDR